jgi:hypothetical protein
MSDPIAIHRKEVAQRIQILNARGGWEGTHTDFKAQLASTPKDLAKLLRHILAFANTPRRTDAYIIFGVTEHKQHQTFTHTGIGDAGFPAAQRIEALVHEYTTLRDIVVDAHCVLDNKRTPYVVIPLQYEGPYSVSRKLTAVPSGLPPNQVYCRYGSSSLRATERDLRRMRTDWARWFLDCRYEQTATSLIAALDRRFPRHTQLADAGDYVRVVYESDLHDEFGTHRAPVLVHAYWGFDPVQPDAVHRISNDPYRHAFKRTIVGPRFTSATIEAAADALVRCVPLDEIYFVNDPYAQLCREFLRKWNEDRAARGLVVDLDYSLSVLPPAKQQPQPLTSVLSFLEEQLRIAGRSAVLIHGAFGCGKTTTAKEFVSGLYEDYLRAHQDTPKVLYVNVNNLDIRSRRDECIESELRSYRLTRDHVDEIVRLVRDDQIHLIFDAVDEMAHPYSAKGRLDVSRPQLLLSAAQRHDDRFRSPR